MESLWKGEGREEEKKRVGNGEVIERSGKGMGKEGRGWEVVEG